jgi:uncharacterized protein YceK
MRQEDTMKNLLAVAALAALVSGCATPLHHGHGSSGGPGMDMQAMERMHERMHERMAAAGSPAQREALLQEHRKMMREHMQDMGSMCGGKGEPGAGSHTH